MPKSRTENHDWWAPKQLSSLRSEREVSPAFDIQPRFHATYLSLHNVEPYWGRLNSIFRRFDLAGSNLFIAHNGGPESDLQFMRTLAEAANVSVHTIINPPGLSGYAGLMLNMDLLRNYEWVTTLHQDDVYQPHHIQASMSAARASEASVGMIYGELISRDLAWRPMSNPRAHWFLEKCDPMMLFETSISHHPFPFSGATFRTKVLEDYPVSLDSVAFQDTEICLKMSRDWTFTHCRDLLVDYLENPSSESHSIDNSEWQRGATDALIRVLSYGAIDEALEICSSADKKSFLSRIERSVDRRISSAPDKERLLAHVRSKVLGSESGVITVSTDEHSERQSTSAHYRAQKSAHRTWPNEFKPLANVRLRIILALKVTLAWLPLKLQKQFWKRLLSGPIGRAFFPNWYFLAQRNIHF